MITKQTSLTRLYKLSSKSINYGFYKIRDNQKHKIFKKDNYKRIYDIQIRNTNLQGISDAKVEVDKILERIDPSLQTTIKLKYNNNIFKLETTLKKATIDDFLTTFANNVSPQLIFFNNNLKKLLQTRESLKYKGQIYGLKTKLLGDTKASIEEKGLSLPNKNDFQMFYKGKFLNKNDNVFNYPEVNISDVIYSQDSFKHKNISLDLKTYYNAYFQERLNTIIDSQNPTKRTYMQVKDIFSDCSDMKKYKYDYTINLILINKFFKDNSKHFDIQIIDKVNLSPIEKNDIYKIMIIKNKDQDIKTLNKDNINNTMLFRLADNDTPESLEEACFECFSNLNLLARLTDRPYYFGLITDGKKWKFLMLKNSKNVVESDDNFYISNPYIFHAYSVGKDPLESNNSIYNFFMDIIENLLKDPSSFIKNFDLNKNKKNEILEAKNIII